jgi:hypothetical protein
MSVPLDARAASTLVPVYMAPAAELLSHAIPAPPADQPVAVVAEWSALVLAALQERHPLGRYFVFESMPHPALALLEARVPRAYGRSLPMPLKAHCVAGVVQGLVVSDAATDLNLIRDAARVLKPGGTYAAAFLLGGTFDTYFEAARRDADALAHPQVHAALDAAALQFRSPDALRTVAGRAGLVDVELGMEERALHFPTARAFLTDAGVQNMLLRHVTITDAGLRAALQDRLLNALESGMDGGLYVRVVTGVLRGTKAADGT